MGMHYYRRGGRSKEGIAHLCAYEQRHTQPDPQARAHVILRPEVLGHVLDDPPICLTLLLVGLGLLSEQRIILGWLGRLLLDQRLGLRILFGQLLGMLFALHHLDSRGMVGFAVLWCGGKDAGARPSS